MGAGRRARETAESKSPGCGGIVTPLFPGIPYPMLPALIALLLFVITGVGLTRWLQRPRTTSPAPSIPERSAAQLASLRWRSFARLVLQAMRARGYQIVTGQGLPADGIPTDGSDILLERDNERTLLSCKYGSASVVTSQALLGIPATSKLRGALHAIVVTPGKFDHDAIALARQHNIELIDGEELWPEVRPYVNLPPEPVAPPPPPPPRHAGLIAWGGAAAIGLVAWMFAQGLQSPSLEDATAATTTAAPSAPPPAASPANPRPVPTAPDPATAAAAQPAIPTDSDALDQRRREAANAISTLFGVDRALWSTQSTLLVYLSTADADLLNELCPLLERYPELAASRLQLQPPSGSNKPVRFKQCRSF